MSDSLPNASVPSNPGNAAPSAPAAGPSGQPVTLPVVERNLLGDGALKAGPDTSPGGIRDGAPGGTKLSETGFQPTDYKFTVPQGIDASDPVVGAFAAAAADAGVTPETAQRLVDAAGPEIVKAMTAPYQAWKDLQENWQTQVRNDPEIGGAKFDRVVLPTIVKAMARYGDPGLREALETTGAGNNPAIIRTLYTLSRMVTEGRLVQGNPVQSMKSAAERMYPSHSNGR
jgi:hypothetical protein